MNGTEETRVCNALIGSCRIAKAVNILVALSSSLVYLDIAAKVARVARVIPSVETLARKLQNRKPFCSVEDVKLAKASYQVSREDSASSEIV
jgi:hypothetical protein